MEELKGLLHQDRTELARVSLDSPVDEFYPRVPTCALADVEQDILFMIAKLEQMTRLLPACMENCEALQMDLCEALAQEVRRQAKMLARRLVASNGEGGFPAGVVRLPLRLERLADELGSILTCCRIKGWDGLQFTDDAQADLEQALALLLDMTVSFRDVIGSPNELVLEYVISQGNRVARLLRHALQGHRARMEGGECSPEVGSLFLDMVDSLKSANEYWQKMAGTLLGCAAVDATLDADRSGAGM